MDSAFLKILNMGLSASWLVLAVLLLRPALRRAPKWTRCLLWAVVAARLLCPFSLESALSLVPSAEPLPEATLYDAHPRLETGVPILNEAAAPVMERAFAPQLGDSVNPLQVWIHVGALVWLAGAAAMMLYAAVSTAGLRRRVAASVERDGAYICDGVESPFILGVLRPRVYIPSGLTEPALSHVLAHERAHLARRDHLWKPLGFALLTVYWFNPLLWPAYILLCRDIELACDERVYRDMPLAARADYSQALFEQSRGRRVAACPLAFGETDVKTRVKAALRYKKPAVWLAVLAVAVCAAAAACFLTNPQRLALDFPREALTGAEVRHAETAEARSLTDEELDGLYRRLEDLGGARRGSFEGTPLYTLTATVAGEGELQVRGYVSDGSATELRYKNKSWRVSGGDLAQYVLALCLNVPGTASAASWSADLDGDGDQERIVLNTAELSAADSTTPWVESAAGVRLFDLAETGVPHAGWQTYALTDYGSRSYLLHYSPSLYQGEADYVFELLELRGGFLVPAERGEAVFSADPDKLKDNRTWLMADFMERANDLWSHSRLLFSTDPEVLAHLYDEQGAPVAVNEPFYIETGARVHYVETMRGCLPALAVMGYDVAYTDAELAPGHYLRTYTAVIDGENVTVAQSYGFELDDHVVDLDGDGVADLVCNCVGGGDGVRRVYVYRRGSDGVECGSVDYDKLDLTAWDDWGANSTAEWYDPAAGTFVIEYSSLASSTMSRTFIKEFGLEAFSWRAFDGIWID